MSQADVIKLIVDTPLCAPCLAAKSGVTEVVVQNTLREIAKTIAVVVARRPCRGCHEVKQTHTVHSRN